MLLSHKVFRLLLRSGSGIAAAAGVIVGKAGAGRGFVAAEAPQQVSAALHQCKPK
jgi:hypothetical protein